MPTATYTPTVGDTISFESYNSPYQGAPELTNSSSGVFSLVGSATPGIAPTPPVISIPTFVASGNGSTASNPPYAEAIVTLDNVSFTTSPTTLATNTTYTLVDKNGATTHLYGYASDSSVAASVTAADALNPTGFGGTYNVTGFVDEYYGVPEIYPLSITTVSGSQVPEPASLGLFALSGVALLGRRRRHA